MKAATVAVCLLLLTSGCIVQTEGNSSDTPTPSVADRVDQKASSPADPTTPSAAAYDVNVDRIENLIHKKMNQRRSAHGLEPLDRSEKLDDIARYKSWDMAQRDYFKHKGPEGQPFGYLRQEHNATCTTFGQNLHRTNFSGISVRNRLESPEKVSTIAVNSLMNSTGHRQNILNPDYKAQGIGVFVDENGTVFVTQEFCG